MKKIAILILVSFILTGCSEPETAAEDQASPDKPRTNIELTDHNVYISFSDKLSFKEGELIAKSASVPEAIVIGKNIYVYFVNALRAHEGDGQNIYYIMSEDGGETWTEREVAVIDGLSEGTEPVDPSLIELEDGTIRMYFYDLRQRKVEDKEWIIYSAISEDGENFTMEDGTRLVTDENMTDPEVILFEDTWFMYYAGGERRGTCVASSDDGLNFEDHGPISEMPFQGIPGAITTNGEIFIFGDNGLASSTDGLNFTIGKGKAMQGFDPSPIEYDGSYIMIYKDFSDNFEAPPTG